MIRADFRKGNMFACPQPTVRDGSIIGDSGGGDAHPLLPKKTPYVIKTMFYAHSRHPPDPPTVLFVKTSLSSFATLVVEQDTVKLINNEGDVQGSSSSLSQWFGELHIKS